jgi:hypothetical protein
MGCTSAMYLEVSKFKSLPEFQLTCQGFLQILSPIRQVLQIRLPIISSMTVPIHYDHNVPTITEALVKPSLNIRRID